MQNIGAVGSCHNSVTIVVLYTTLPYRIRRSSGFAPWLRPKPLGVGVCRFD